MVAVGMSAASVSSSLSVREETEVTEPASFAAIVISPSVASVSSVPSGFGFVLPPCLRASVVDSSSKERATL
jgi:hypothetical protein